MRDALANPADFSWPFWPALPIYPYGARKTLRLEVLGGQIWTFEQVQGILYVIVPIRMTVIKLRGGGLLIYGAIAPTPECLRLLGELVADYGEVKYIIHPTVSGLEHKVFVGPLARACPQAQVFVVPGQWSFPINLPLSWLGFPPQRTHLLPPNPEDAPFAEEFAYRVLGPASIGWGSFGEGAFFHKLSQTLLVTDTLISLPAEAPPLLQENPYSLLFHARNRAQEAIKDTPLKRCQGWQRTCLLALYFQPHVLKIDSLTNTLKCALQAPERSAQSYWGLFPFQWHPDWSKSFEALRGDGRVFVAPILQTLICNRFQEATLDWVDAVCGWDFARIIPSHFQAPLEAKPADVHQAFHFLRVGASSPEGEEWQALLKLEEILQRLGVVIPRQT